MVEFLVLLLLGVLCTCRLSISFEDVSLLHPCQCPVICEAVCLNVLTVLGCTLEQCWPAWPALSAFNSSTPRAGRTKARKLFHYLVVEPVLVLHFELFGSLQLCSCDTRNTGEDIFFFFFIFFSLFLCVTVIP